MCADASVQRPCSTLSNDKKFLLDMLYSKTAASVPLSPTAASAADSSEDTGSVQAGERAHDSTLQLTEHQLE